MGYRMNPRTGQMEMQGVQHGVDHMKPAPMPYAPHVAGADANGVVQNSVGTWGQPLQDTRAAIFRAMSDPNARGMFQNAAQGGMDHYSTANDFQNILSSGSFGGVPLSQLMSQYGAGSQGAAGAQDRAGLMPQLDPATGQVVNVPATVPGGNIAPPVNSGGSVDPYASMTSGQQAAQQWSQQNGGADPGLMPESMPTGAALQSQLQTNAQFANGATPGLSYNGPSGMMNAAVMPAPPTLGGLAMGRGGFFNRRMY